MTTAFAATLEEVRRGVDLAAGVERELMATYLELGELLGQGCVTPDDAEDCRDLVGRLIRLGEAIAREAAQQWAMGAARNLMGGER